MATATDDLDAHLLITRTIDAPLALVWKVHSEAEHLVRWWGPKGCTIPECTLDFRPGGRFHYCLRGPDGSEMWGKFEYREIEKPSRIVYVSSFSDPSGATTRAPFMADFPLKCLNIITFSEENGRTTLHLDSAPLDATEAEWLAFKGMHASMQMGFGGTFEQLLDYLKTL
jgi:uncharacterized protein YndB with AHSA1/START domain